MYILIHFLIIREIKIIHIFVILELLASAMKATRLLSD